MPKPSNRDKILAAGLQVVHTRGFGGASVRDIVAAAGVPQGSFTNHFGSKDAFALEVLDLYAAAGAALLDATLGNASLTPLARLTAYLQAARAAFDPARGCMLGNFGAELGECSDALRQRLAQILDVTQAALAACLSSAVAAGELAPLDTAAMAGFILSGLQGATLMAKIQHSPEPMDTFGRLLLQTVLEPASSPSPPQGPPQRPNPPNKQLRPSTSVLDR
jgi:TetR/AcrR family transcriptional repressor of nem operon